MESDTRKNLKVNSKLKVLVGVFTVSLLVACGGGGGGPPTASVTDQNTRAAAVNPADIVVRGTAATAQAIADAPITAKCQTGAGSTASHADGTYSLFVARGKLPCVLQMTNPANGQKLHTAAIGETNSVVANLTPLSEMVTARVLHQTPSLFFGTFDAELAARLVTLRAVMAAQTDVGGLLVDSVDARDIDYLVATLQAVTASTVASQDMDDELLNELTANIDPDKLAQVVAALASTASMADLKTELANVSVTQQAE